MAKAKTKRSDVVATFHRYLGRNPTTSTDWDTVRYLMTKPPQEVEKRLSESVRGGNKNTEQNIDPIAEARKLGYTADDFKNDPGFVNYWKNKSVEELKAGLSKRSDFNKTNGKKKLSHEITKEEEDYNWINSLDISDEQKEMLKFGYDNTDIGKISTPEELEKQAREATRIAEMEIKPYYQDLKNRDMEDLKNSYSDIRNEALRYQQKEEKSYGEILEKTKQNLRARGLTFSGRSRGVLGKEGALDAKGVEGELPQERRYNWEDARASWQERSRDLGTRAEREYGSDGLYGQRNYLNPEGLPDPYDNGLNYNSSSKSSLYSPHRKNAKYGYVDSDSANISRRKKRDIEYRASDIINTNNRNN